MSSTAERDDLIGQRVEWQGQSWFVAVAQHDQETSDDPGHWHLTLSSPSLSSNDGEPNSVTVGPESTSS